jgi:hypothetical protein
VRGARLRQPLPPGAFCVLRQPPLDGRVRRGRHPGLVQDAQRVDLAGRLDDPRQHQLQEHLVAARRAVEAQHPVTALEGV